MQMGGGIECARDGRRRRREDGSGTTADGARGTADARAGGRTMDSGRGEGLTARADARA